MYHPAAALHQPSLLGMVEGDFGAAKTVREVSEMVRMAFAALRKRHVGEEVLMQQVNVATVEEWHAVQGQLLAETVQYVNSAVSQYKLGAYLIVAGVDEEGHLYSIYDPGTSWSFDDAGYCCVGAGQQHANAAFAWHGYSKSFTRNEALYVAYEAKRKAEMAGGVGRATDIRVIDSKGVHAVSDATIDRLDSIYRRRQRRAFGSRITSLEIEWEAQP